MTMVLHGRSPTAEESNTSSTSEANMQIGSVEEKTSGAENTYLLKMFITLSERKI